MRHPHATILQSDLSTKVPGCQTMQLRDASALSSITGPLVTDGQIDVVQVAEWRISSRLET